MEFTDISDGLSVISVSKAKIPAYLQAGDFFQSLHTDDTEETLDVPSNALKLSTTVASVAELAHLLTSLRFWVVTDPIIPAVGFILTNKAACEIDVEEFVADFPYLRVFQDIPNCEQYNYIDKAIKFCDLAMITVLFHLGEKFSRGVAPILFGRAGNLDIVKFARQHGVICGKYTFQEACEYGHLQVVTYLHCNNVASPDYVPMACVHAVKGGHLEVLKFLHSRGYEWGALCARHVGSYGHLECLQYLHENECEWDTEVFCNAAEHGHVSILQYLHAHHAPVDEYDLSRAAGRGGHLCVIVYLRGIDVACDTRTLQYAARHGHAHIVAYLLEEGCPHNTSAINDALEHGHSECVGLLLEKGLDCSAVAVDYALLNRQAHLVRHIAVQLDLWTPELYLRAVRVSCPGHFLCALYDLGCPISDEVMRALEAEGKFMKAAVEHISTRRTGGAARELNGITW